MGRLVRKVNLMKSIDADTIPIRKDSFLTNAYVIELPLDSLPCYDWQTVFETEWKSSLNLWDRKLVVVGDKVHLVTTHNEIGEKIDWLNKVIESTNARIDELNKTQKILEKQRRTEELRKRESVIRDEIRIRMA